MPDDKVFAAVAAYVRSIPDIDVDAALDAVRLRTTHRQLEAMAEQFLVKRMGVCTRHLEVMELLFQHPDKALNLTDLAEGVSVTRAAMTGTVDALERDGYAQRTPHPHDRRVILVELTPQGRKLMARELPELYRAKVQLVAGLSLQERRRMLDYYTRIYHKIQQLLSDLESAKA